MHKIKNNAFVFCHQDLNSEPEPSVSQCALWGAGMVANEHTNTHAITVAAALPTSTATASLYTILFNTNREKLQKEKI